MAVPLIEHQAEAVPVGNSRDVEELEVELLLAGMSRRYGYDFTNYARTSLTRRLRRAVKEEGVSTISALQDRVLHDPVAMSRVVESISVHTTNMFRDADVYRAMRTQVVPILKTYPFVRIWHAGCSSGEEVYSLAILLHEEGIYERCRIYATDISDPILERAKRGVFPLRSMREYTTNYQAAGGINDFSSYYATDAENVVFRQSLRRNMIFSQHNLVCDAAFNEFQLILCRNVVIYFDQVLRSRVHELMHASLAKLGLLVLGKRESIRFTRVEPFYQEVVPNLRIYRRMQ
ncbi:MAG TPA: protein-glutamate O-methyltransferase CheR [Polyangiaceae bacterium]|jgi:chemotaxis protein methyltransferase CheR|nr:protein-glutamate O-methyltransferase CheR [Polyangiaceae bacterium]